MPNVDLGSIPRDVNMMIARIGAIESYAKIEQSLCELFASLMGTLPDKAAIVFFRITNTHARNAIIETLLDKAHGIQYDTYWYGIPHQKNGLLRIIRQLDQKRNEIVHWHGSTNIAFAGESYTATERLIPPNLWGDSSASISIDDLNDFIERATFTHRSLFMFNWMTSRKTEPLGVGFYSARSTWMQIFQQPASYPPANTHPLSPNYKAPENPLRPSQA